MPLINTSVPNLIQGVSQQPDATRFAGQCEEQENALSSVASGLKKRPNTRHVGKLLTSAIGDDSFVHFINRDDNEKYVVIHDGTFLYAYNINTGVEAEIKVGTNCYKASWTTAEATAHNTATPANTTTYVQSGYPVSSSYLDAYSPRTDLQALTVADNTFILNKKVTVSASTAISAALPKEAIVYVSQGDYEKEYEVSFSKTEPFKISFDLDKSQFTGYVYAWAGSINVTTNTLYETGPYDKTRRYYVRTERDATIIEGGEGYKPNQTFADNYIVRIHDLLKYPDVDIEAAEATHNQSYHTSINVKLETDADGVVTAAKVQPTGTSFIQRVGHNHQTGGGSSTSAVYKHWDLFLRPPAPDGITFGNLGKIVAKTGAADQGQGGLNSDTKQIAYLLGFDSREVSNGSRTTETTSNIVDSSRLSTPEVKGSVIKYARADGKDLSISTTDGLGDLGLVSTNKEVPSISDLPAKNFNGFKIKIVGDVELNQDDYYVEFVTDGGAYFGTGSYQEIGSFGTQYKLDDATLPLTLINDGVNSFTLDTVSYDERKAGDGNSNPFPAFVGKTISNIFFYKNRLGLLSRGDITLSESGQFFNFFRTTVTTLLDSDPISVSVSSTKVTTLKAAVGFQENLVLFSPNGQFVLKGGNVLTPKNVSVTPITNFSFEDQVNPLPLGSYIYFPFTRGSFTGLREFTVNSTTDTYDSVEVTEHVPSYIPSNIIDMTGTTSEDIIALLSADEKGSLYVYNYFWNNNQKVLSAWSKFTFTGEIRGIEFLDSTLYAVTVNNGETNLVEMPLESGLTDTAGYVTHLDMRVASTVTNGNNQIILPYTPADNSVEVYTTDGLKLNATNSGATVTLAQAVSADTPVFVGIPYTMKYTFSEQLFKAKAGNGASPSNAAKMRIRNGSIYFADTAYFKVKVTPKHRDTYENVFTPDVVGSTTLGSLSLDSGFYRFPVFTKPQDTTITIENDSALPSTFQSAEFESFVHSRSNRYG